MGRKKIEFWRGRECKYRTEAFNSFDRIKDAIGNDRKVKRMLMSLKESMLDREWAERRNWMAKKLTEQSGRMYRRHLVSVQGKHAEYS